MKTKVTITIVVVIVMAITGIICGTTIGYNSQVSWAYLPQIGNHNITVFWNWSGVEIIYTDCNRQAHNNGWLPHRVRID